MINFGNAKIPSIYIVLGLLLLAAYTGSLIPLIGTGVILISLALLWWINPKEERTVDSEIICYNCKATLDEDAKFCASCQSPVAKGGLLECPSCKEFISVGSKFCKHCAAEILPKAKVHSFSPVASYAAQDISTNSNGAKTIVKSPAIGLVCIGIISALINLWSLSLLTLVKDKRNSNDMGDEMLALYIMLSITILVMAGLIIYGAFQMMSLKSFGWSKTAAILSICTVISVLPGLFLGVPVGIWALIVLSKPEVKTAFQNIPQ